MNHAIDFHTTHSPLLTITPRKKTLHNQLVHVEEGKVLLKLGKNEYAYSAGDTFWLPFDCLSSLTLLPGSVFNTVKFSVRLADKFPTQAGQVMPSTLMSALLNSLSKTDDAEIKKDLLQVMRHEVKTCKPVLKQDKESAEITAWTPNSTSITGELALVLLVREARKQKLSGKKSEAICQSLFSGNQEHFKQLTTTLLGEAL